MGLEWISFEDGTARVIDGQSGAYDGVWGNLLWKSVLIQEWTAVEIIRDALPARGVFKGSTFACDGEE